MTRFLPITLVFLCAISPALTASTGTIARVVVYPDRASVTQTLSVQLDPGPNAVAFTGLPMNLDVQSLKVRGEGPSGMKIGAVELAQEFFNESQNEEIRRIETAIEGKSVDLAEIAARATVAVAEQEFFKSLKVKVIDSSQNELSGGKVTVADYKAAADYAFKGLSDSLAAERQAGIDKVRVEKDLQKLQNDLAQLKGGSVNALRNAVVQIEAAQGGRASLELDYIVPGATWSPVYEARFNPSTEQIDWTYGAIVQQSTGQAWENVELSLSTARPSLGAGAPELTPWILNPYQPQPRRDKGMGYAAAPQAKMADALETSSLEESRGRDEAAPAAPIQAVVVDSGMAVQFAIPGKTTVPSGKATKQVTVAVHSFKASYEYHATPRLSEFVYMTAEVTNETDTPFLAGQVRAFHGNEFVGVVPIKQIAVSESFDIPLGAESRIELERTTVQADRSPGGLFGGKARWTYEYRNTLTSHLKKAVEVVVHEQIPVSRDSRVSVFDVSTKPKAGEIDSEGLFEWKQTLSPNEKSDLTITFHVEHPDDMIVSGL